MLMMKIRSLRDHLFLVEYLLIHSGKKNGCFPIQSPVSFMFFLKNKLQTLILDKI